MGTSEKKRVKTTRKKERKVFSCDFFLGLTRSFFLFPFICAKSAIGQEH